MQRKTETSPATSSGQPPDWGLGCTALTLATVLTLLFWRTWLPGFVLASNDGPLGATLATYCRDAGISSWNDLHALGFAEPGISPDLSALLGFLLGPVGMAKAYAPLALLFLGFTAWVCFRRLGVCAAGCLIGALAVALNSDFVSIVAWGVGGQTVAIGFDFLAVAALAGLSNRRGQWIRLALAGAATGMGVCEAWDIGALFSLFVGGFALWQLWNPRPKTAAGLARVAAGLALVVACAAVTAASTLYALIGTQIQGIEGMAQDRSTKQARWDSATQWSLPKTETLGLLAHGLFGYRMDTPKGMALGATLFRHGQYWGAVGRSPAAAQYIDTYGAEGDSKGLLRFTGGGIYAGALVILAALWGLAQALRGRNSPFDPDRGRMMLFWAAAGALALALSYGRYGSLYSAFYALPYMSTIRNPAKFIHIFTWALTLLFALSVDALAKVAPTPRGKSRGPLRHLKSWLRTARWFDRGCFVATLAALGAAAFAAWCYSNRAGDLTEWLERVGFPDDAGGIARFSIRQGFRAAGVVTLAGGLLLAWATGFLASLGRRLEWVTIGLFLTADLLVANLPWIIAVDWKHEYDVANPTGNPVIDFLRAQGYDARVGLFPLECFLDLASLPPAARPEALAHIRLASQYHGEWLQRQFPYNDIAALEVVQLPRPPLDFCAFERAVARYAVLHWQLTGTKYILGLASLPQFLGLDRDLLRPARDTAGRELRFTLAPKPGVTPPRGPEDVTSVLSPTGEFQIFELEGSLPRVAVFERWEVATGPQAALARVSDPARNPRSKVVLCEDPGVRCPPTGREAARAQVVSYRPKRIGVRARAGAPTVVVLNNRFDEGWAARVDGKAAKLLRCNFIAQGVLVPPGEHDIVFTYARSVWPFITSTIAILAAVATLAGLGVVARRVEPQTAPEPVRNVDPPESLAIAPGVARAWRGRP